MRVRIAQISDTHLGLTEMSSIRKMLLKVKEEKFDILLHNGDYCGGVKGHKSIRSTVKAIREILGDISYVSVIGNHDAWYTGKIYNIDRIQRKSNPSLYQFTQNYNKIIDTFKAYNVHFLDLDGPYRDPRFQGLAIVGHTGWYSGMKIVYEKVNDFKWLPLAIEGDTHFYMQKRAYNDLMKNLNLLEKKDKHIIFASHFPTVSEVKDNLFYWHYYIADMLKDNYNCRYFLHGHNHERHEGPLRYECGSNYFVPNYQIVEAVFDE